MRRMTGWVPALLSAPLWIVCGCSDPCADYTDDPRLLAQCSIASALDAPTLDAARCERAGPQAEDCRMAWMAGHTDLPVARLAQGCTTDECRFAASDFAMDDLAATIPVCGTLVLFQSQCVAHATLRFLGGHPTVEAQKAAFALLTAWDDVLARQVGSYLACGGVSACALVGASAQVCEDARTLPQAQDQCSAFRPNFPAPPP